MSELHEVPISWSHTGDAERPYAAVLDGDQLVVAVNDFPAEPLYTLYVNGEPALDLDDWPTTWTRPGRVVDGNLLLAWATRLCQMVSDDTPTVTRGLGIGGEAGSGSPRPITPPTDGFEAMHVVEDKGRFFSLHTTFARSALTRASFDTTFGEGVELPRVHHDHPYNVGYRVELPGAPWYVDVFAVFDEQPLPQACAVGANLRRTAAR